MATDHKTRVQKEIVPALRVTNPALGESLNALEEESRKLYQAFYGKMLPEIKPDRITFASVAASVKRRLSGK